MKPKFPQLGFYDHFKANIYHVFNIKFHLYFYIGEKISLRIRFQKLERQLNQLNSNLRPEKAIDIARAIYVIKGAKPVSNEVIQQTLIPSEEQKQLVKLFNL